MLCYHSYCIRFSDSSSPSPAVNFTMTPDRVVNEDMEKQPSAEAVADQNEVVGSQRVLDETKLSSTEIEGNLTYEDDDQEPKIHFRTWTAVAAMFLLNFVQVIALQGPPVVVSSIFRNNTRGVGTELTLSSCQT